MKIILLISALIVLAQCLPTPDEIEKEWQNFKIKYRNNSVDTLANDDKRRQIFADNYRSIVKHNLEADAGNHTYRMGVNQFTDMTADEFEHKMLGLKANTVLNITNNQQNMTEFIKQTDIELPTSVDWMAQESRVKDQRQCGACFAFAAIDTIESHYTITSGQKIELSPQNIIDCLGRPDVCTSGGSVLEVYQLVYNEGGVESEHDYPYQGYYQGCRYNRNLAQLTLSGAQYYTSGNENVLKSMVDKGPVAIYIFASNKLQHYQSGIFSDDQCNHPVNHAVVAVGYGDGQDYWLIKNSWGTSWGDGGYFKLARNQGNMCQVGWYCFIPTGVHKVNHQQQVKVGNSAAGNIQYSLFVSSLMLFAHYILN